jgi:hypothetical protein
MTQILWLLGGFIFGYLIVKGALAFITWAEKQEEK